MNSHKSRARVLHLVPAVKATFGSVDTWVNGRSFPCSWNRNNSSANVRAGRDSEEVTASLYYQSALVKINITDRIEIDGARWTILYLHKDSTEDGETMLELKAIG